MPYQEKYARFREEYREARLEGQTPKSFGNERQLSRSALTSLYLWWKKNYPEEVSTAPASEKYESYYEDYRQARLRGESQGSFRKRNGLNKSGVTSVHLWWKKNYPEEAENAKQNRVPKYAGFEEEFRKSRLKGESYKIFLEQTGLPERAIWSLYDWWKTKYPEEAKNSYGRYVDQRENYRKARLEGESPQSFGKRMGLNKSGLAALYSWWKTNYPEEVKENRPMKYKEFYEQYRESRLNGEAPSAFLRRTGLSRKAISSLTYWWKTNYPEEAKSVSIKNKWEEYREDYRQGRIKGETNYGFMQRTKLSKNIVNNLYLWWKTNYPEEVKIIVQPTKSHEDYHETYRQARLQGVRPIEFVEENNITWHDERCLAGWWKNHYPDEYNEHVNRFTISRTTKKFKCFVPVPSIPVPSTKVDLKEKVEVNNTINTSLPVEENITTKELSPVETSLSKSEVLNKTLGKSTGVKKSKGFLRTLWDSMKELLPFF